MTTELFLLNVKTFSGRLTLMPLTDHDFSVSPERMFEIFSLVYCACVEEAETRRNRITGRYFILGSLNGTNIVKSI